jgi:hypothetical protein
MNEWPMQSIQGRAQAELSPFTQYARSQRQVWYALAITLFTATGCHNLLDAGGNGLTQPTAFDNADGAVLRYNQGVASFSLAQSEQVAWTGILTDELTSYSGAYAQVDALHTANVNTAQGYYPYVDLTNARINGLRAIQALQQYAPYPTSRIGELFAYVGLVELYFAENMCSGVPVAAVVNGLPASDVVLTRDSLLGRAVAHFDSSGHYSSDSGVVNQQVLWLANVGRARAFLSQNQLPTAVSAVAGVPLSFVYYNNSFNASSAQQNQMAVQFYDLSSGVANNQGGNGVDFVAASDPRVPTGVLGTVNGRDTVYAFTPETSFVAPIVLASGVEASLIRAEALLRAGNIQAWADTLNALRSSVPALSGQQLPPDSTTAASGELQVDVMFRERAMWLFLTGHRQGDLRRLIRQYGRPLAAVFPTGPDPQLGGSSFGADVTFVPVGEANNPIFHGCVDSNP